MTAVAVAVLAVRLSPGASPAALDEVRLVPLDVTLHDALGVGVAVSGDTALVGAPWDADRGTKSGSVYVFERGPGGTAYQACIYDEHGFHETTWKVDAAGLDCNGTPCWQALGALPPKGKGYLYKRGKRKLRWRAGKAGKSLVVLTARKDATPGPDDPLSGVAIHLGAGSTVQLVGDDASECFSLTVSQVLDETQKRFRAKK